MELGFFEKFSFGKEGVERFQAGHRDMPEYLNRAAAGENRFDLKIDKDWAQFMFESTKMTWIKIVVLLVGIAPSLTRFPTFFMQKLLINGCYVLRNTRTFLELHECIKQNGNSQFINKTFFSFTLNDIISAIGIFFLLSLPQLIFAVVLWIRFKNDKYTVWLSSAKIHLTSFDKKLLTVGYVGGCLLLVALSLKISSFIMDLNENFFRNDYIIPFNNNQSLAFTFDKSDLNSFGTTVSTMLMYSCLLTALFRHLKEPIAFFTGFRKFLKKASKVAYNSAAVDFRIQRDGITWKLIKMYYEQCNRYPPNVVLNALATHFIDLKLLLVAQQQNENESPIDMKTE